MIMMFDYPVIDLHTHLRNNIPEHTKIAKESGIDVVVYMANCEPPLDDLETIKHSLNQKRYCKAIPICAITRGLEGSELVDILRVKEYVVGFSDDGEYLEDLQLLKKVLDMGVLVLAHCSPSYEEGVAKPFLETINIKKYIEVLEKTRGKLHIQHVSKGESVQLIREAKERGLQLTCETCPHYFTFSKDNSNIKVNPPLGTKEDIVAIKRGLKDGTIDVIASDYAPLPRITGIANFKSFITLSSALVSDGILSEEQLKDKLFTNPKKIIESGEYFLNF